MTAEQINRVEGGCAIDYNAPVAFTFNGECLSGYKGDTLASALLASGRHLVARSFKYGRPRGIVAAGAEEPNAIVQRLSVLNKKSAKSAASAKREKGGASAKSEEGARSEGGAASGKRDASVPNIRATQQEIYDGLAAASTSGWPGLRWHLHGFIGAALGRFMPPGFYYKTFMFPARLWRVYEHFIRKAAGFGRAPQAADPDIYDKLHHHPDLLIIGGGPAGLMAALAAVDSGIRILLVDENPRLGGALLHERESIDGKPAREWAEAAARRLGDAPNVTLLTRTTAVGYHDHNFVVACELRADHLVAAPAGCSRQRLHCIRAKQVLLATGACERGLVFANNDVPGCMQASAISAYRHKYGVVPGQKLVLMTTNDHGYQAALDWHEAGREVVAIVDSRRHAAGKFSHAARSNGIRIIEGSAVFEARGKMHVTGALVAELKAAESQDAESKRPRHSRGSHPQALGNPEKLNAGVDGLRLNEGGHELLPCDTIAASGGWSPVVHLSCHTGAKPIWNPELNCFVPGKTRQAMLTAGAVTGNLTLAHALESGFESAREACRKLGAPPPVPVSENSRAANALLYAPLMDAPLKQSPARNLDAAADALFHIPHPRPSSRAPKQFVDLQLDVTAADIELAAREGFESIEHIKRYTALGFGTDQGKLGNINGIAIAARATGRPIDEIGTTMFRPNYTPVAFGAIAGRECGALFDPERHTAIHPWHAAAGARFENVGQWKRPWYYPQPGESMDDSVRRECLAVRGGIGILDASTLGKIDIQGPDAREFLNRIYTNAWGKLPPGQCRYGLMCGEDGMVMDDGVTACLAANHFLMHTTTGGAARVLEWLELWRQTEWPELKVYFNSVTDHWATAAIAGPKARELLAGLTGIPLGNEEFPFMHWRAAEVAGIPARIFRVSFTGELSYEINVQADYGLRLWEALIEQGRRLSITPFGTETMHVLRAEKGFIIVGQDTDGSVTPDDLGMSWAIGRNKAFSFVGKRGMARQDCAREGRKQLVGLLPEGPEQVLPEGGQLLWNPAALRAKPAPMAGHITSSYYSPTLARSFALALVKDGRSKLGQTIHCALPPRFGRPRTAPARIANPVFYDPKGERQHVE